jgi:phenylalanyl-tRNA synthetase alpha chain
MLIKQIEKLKSQAIEEIGASSDLSSLQTIAKKYLGRKKGEFTRILRRLKDLSDKERPKVGKLANQAKKDLEAALKERRKKLAVSGAPKVEKDFDITLPGAKPEFGHLHPITQVRWQAEDIFRSMGFQILEGPEVETDYYNFEALNIPKDHPARDMWDTFYLTQNSKLKTQNLLLRTHTSTMQVRVMEKQAPPLRVVVIGKCFRHEATDASHEHTLYQVEGFVADKEISIANLIYTLKSFLLELFGQPIETRLRPGYFPFVEPGFELDIKCLKCGGKGCPVCSGTGWVELLGCGMIHPKVFEAAGYPKDKYTGFAFGLGLDRLVMARYKIDDIRWFHSGDLRFIRQF